MTLTRRDRTFISLVGLVVLLGCATITELLPVGATSAASAGSGYVVVTASGHGPTATCPSGTNVLGGGGKVTQNNTFRIGNIESFPVVTAYSSAWKFTARNQDYYSLESTVYAICARI